MKGEQARAGFAHEMVMMNLAIFHLLLPVAALSSGYISTFLSLALIGSAVMIFLVARKARQTSDVELVNAHRQLAWRRCRLLLIAYAISTIIMLLGWLLASIQVDQNRVNIMLVVFSRIAAVPIVLAVLILLVMETTALSQARQGIISN
ncbi:MAG: hypothetical protein PSN44_08235 [Gammaproteobacteria bacterium]|nr:hypothetical protein [Gammaproteobacteria bacterium]